MTAFLSRAELLDNTAFEGLRVFGGHNDQATLHVREFLHRNGIPHHWIDIDDPANAALVAAIDGSNGKAPVVAWGAKILLRNPSLHELAAKVGVQRTIPKEPFDTVIIGGGPAGLGAAVYAASEGLHTVVLDRIGPGGQAGASSRIENYAGFPSGLSGRDLALRSYLQALKFGAVFSAPVNVRELRCAGGDLHEVVTDEGEVVRTRTIIIAAGVSYRTLGVRGLNQLRGAGVYFSATQVEAMLCRAGPVHIIGAGNSAGQAAMYLSRFTDRVRLIVRGGNIRKGMSSYLAERVEVNPHIDIRLHSELRAVEGSGCLERVHIENTAAGQTSVEDSVGVFIFIGATPCTDFLGSAIRRDEKGYIVTGAEVSAAGAWPAQDRQPCALETSCPGVFAAGDCRSRTTKRVAFAVGDGALAVTCVHDFLGTYD
jgi:thioredoxin reductase (NADPH)